MRHLSEHSDESEGRRPGGGPLIRRPRRRATAVLDMPLADRQQIVVMPDEAFEGPPSKPVDIGASRLGRVASDVRRKLPPRIPGSTQGPVDARLQAVRELREDGVALAAISSHQASSLVLPIGHPRIGVVYVCDPAETNRYWPAAELHRRVFESKFAEAARLLMALGARSMQVRSERGWTGEMAAGMLAPVSRVMKRTAQVNAKVDRSSQMLLEAVLEPTAPPEIPQGLIWYPHEPSWQMVAEGRMHRGLTSFALSVESTDDYGVNADFEMKVARSKLLQVGGEFTAHKATKWVIEGQFTEASTDTAVRGSVEPGPPGALEDGT